MKKGIIACAFLSTAVANPLPRHATLVSRQIVNETQYDFIIAGGGIAGLTAANRLTEDPSGETACPIIFPFTALLIIGIVNVLVIEAGPFDQGEAEVLVPGKFSLNRYTSLLQSVPQKALNNQKFIVPFGRVVGGGSAVNALVWLRSAKAEYDSWDKQLGDSGWNWNTLLPYFEKSEKFTPPSQSYAREANISFIDNVHGKEGPVHVSYPNFFWNGSGESYYPHLPPVWHSCNKLTNHSQLVECSARGWLHSRQGS